MSFALILGLPDFERPLEVHSNALDRVIRGVLVQERHPVAFESQKLNETEQSYLTHEKEMKRMMYYLGT